MTQGFIKFLCAVILTFVLYGQIIPFYEVHKSFPDETKLALLTEETTGTRTGEITKPDIKPNVGSGSKNTSHHSNQRNLQYRYNSLFGLYGFIFLFFKGINVPAGIAWPGKSMYIVFHALRVDVA